MKNLVYKHFNVNRSLNLVYLDANNQHPKVVEKWPIFSKIEIHTLTKILNYLFFNSGKEKVFVGKEKVFVGKVKVLQGASRP